MTQTRNRSRPTPKKRFAEHQSQLTFIAPLVLRQRVEALVEYMAATHAKERRLTGGQPGLSMVLRWAMEAGVEVLERERDAQALTAVSEPAPEMPWDDEKAAQ